MALVRNPSFGIRRQMIAALLVFTGIGVFLFGVENTLPQVLTSSIVAVFLDFFLQYIRRKKFYFSETALITGLIIALVLDVNAPLAVVALAASIAILGKHLLRKNGRHIFNPASFGLVLSALIFPVVGHTWWGESSLIITLLLGLLIMWRIFKWDMVATYLLTFFLINTAFAFSQGRIEFAGAEFGATISVFFLLFMFLEPQTSPSLQKKRLFFGAFSGLLSFLFFHAFSFSFLITDALLYTLLGANLLTAFYSWRWIFLSAALLSAPFLLA